MPKGNSGRKKNKDTFSNFEDFYKKIEDDNIDTEFQVTRNNGAAEKWRVYRYEDDRFLEKEEDGIKSRLVRVEWHGGEDYENIYETYKAKVYNEKIGYAVRSELGTHIKQDDFVKRLKEDARLNFQDIKSIKIKKGTVKKSKYE